MDTFNIVWCTLWSDFFMAQHQFNFETNSFAVAKEYANDFQYYLSGVLNKEVIGIYTDENEDNVYLQISNEEIELVTDWILNFNQNFRKPMGIPLPDLYFDNETIKASTVVIYCESLSQFSHYLLENQNDRDRIGKWALENISQLYVNTAIEAKKIATTTL